MSAEPDVVARARDCLQRTDVEGLAQLLGDVGEEQRRVLGAWVGGSRRWISSLGNRLMRQVAPVCGEDDPASRSTDIWYMEAMLAVATLGPATASDRVRWRELFGLHRDGLLTERLLEVFRRRDPEWVAAFAERASHAPRDVEGMVYSTVVHGALVHHGLRCPSGPTFAATRVIQPREGSLADRLTDEPLMPEVLLIALRHGHGNRVTRLPDEIPALLERGLVDRSDFLTMALETLTAATPVANQRVLAKTLVRLGLRPEEVTGGLPFLLGVLSTSTSAVGVALLPLAIDLVETTAELGDVVDLVAARPERGQKSTVLAWLGREETLMRFGAMVVSDAVRRLVEFDEDAAFGQRAQKLLDRIQPEGVANEDAIDRHEESAIVSAASGLWTRRPEPQQVPEPIWWAGAPRTWNAVISKDLRGALAREEYPAWVCNEMLAEMAVGTLNVEDLVASVEASLVENSLSVLRLTKMVEELFLGGGLSYMWRPALDIADALTSRRPAGLLDYLRMLASYAVECPPTLTPQRLAALAASGDTKASVEAALLVQRLGTTTTAELSAQSPVEPRDARPRVLGLWGPPADARPPLGGFSWSALESPADLAFVDSWIKSDTTHVYGRGGNPGAFDWVKPSLTVQLLVQAISDHGADKVREAVSLDHVQSPALLRPPGPVAEAARLFARGQLEPAALIALRAAVPMARTDMGYVEDPVAWDGTGFEKRVRLDRIVASGHVALPHWLLDPACLLHLLHTAECLLLAQRPVPRISPLSCPVLTDGSLRPDTVLERLKEPGPVGPLDLMLALNRMIEVDRVDRTRLDCLDPNLMTDPELSHGAPLPIAATMRRWIDAGGPSSLASSSIFTDVQGSHDPHRAWRHTATRPVPWSEVAAAPPGLDDLENCSTLSSGAWLRINPRWPDLARQRSSGFYDMFGDDEFEEQLGLVGHGPPTAQWVVNQLFIRRPGRILQSVTRARPDWLSEADLTTAVLDHAETGTITPSTAVPVLESLFVAATMRTWWAPALALADYWCRAAHKPNGLARMLAMLADHVHECPEPASSPGILELAQSRGSSRAHIEARRLTGATTP